MNFSQGNSGTKVQFVNRTCFFLRKDTRIHRKMGDIHELFVLALSLVWFAGATPLIALIALVPFFHSTPGTAHLGPCSWLGVLHLLI